MKKSLLLITMLLLSAAWVVAQTTAPAAPSASQPSATDSQAPAAPSVGSQTSTGDQAKATAKADNSIRGCLSGAAGSYTLVDSASGKTYNLTGKTDDLSAHVGQEVELNGSSASASAGSGSDMGASASKPSDSSASASASGATGTGKAEANNFDVKSVTKIADTCSNK